MTLSDELRRRSLNRIPGPLNTRPGKVLIGFFTITGLAVLALWLGYFLDGTASSQLTEPVVETGTMIGRILGASIAGLTVILAASALLYGRWWAAGLASVGIGASGYAALNTLGETLALRSWSTIPVALVLLSALLAAWLFNRPIQTMKIPTTGLLLGLAGFASWVVVRSLRASGSGPFDSHEVTAWAATHYLAELTMATLTIVGMIGWACQRQWGQPLALAGLGMYIYSTLNAADWAALNDRWLLPTLGITLTAAVAGSIFLITNQPGRT